jgi:hypothetical protein
LVSWFQCRVALNVQTNLIKNEQNSGIKRALAVVMLLQFVKPYENAVLVAPAFNKGAYTYVYSADQAKHLGK